MLRQLVASFPLDSLDFKSVAQSPNDGFSKWRYVSLGGQLALSRITVTDFIMPFGDLRSCSQTRMRRIPISRNILFVCLSRCLFRHSLAAQNSARVFGVWPQRGQLCQKQPSTNTATRGFEKKKSGLPGKPPGWRTHPLTPWRTSAIRKRTSVVLLLLPRIADIIRERFKVTPTNLPFGSFDLRRRSISM